MSSILFNSPIPNEPAMDSDISEPFELLVPALVYQSNFYALDIHLGLLFPYVEGIPHQQKKFDSGRSRWGFSKSSRGIFNQPRTFLCPRSKFIQGTLRVGAFSSQSPGQFPPQGVLAISSMLRITHTLPTKNLDGLSSRNIGIVIQPSGIYPATPLLLNFSGFFQWCLS